MADPTAAGETVNPLSGVFELRDWEPPRPIETPSGVLAWEVASALVSCQSAVLRLATGRSERVIVVGGASRRLTPIQGNLLIDGADLSVKGHVAPEEPDRATTSLTIPRNSRVLGFDLELRNDRLTASLFGRSPEDMPYLVQVSQFYRPGAKGPDRRPPEKPLSPIQVPAPAAQGTVRTPAPPKPDRPTQLAEDWGAMLCSTQLLHEANDFQSDYGGSTYIERRIALHLSDDGFVLDRATTSRVSYAGMTSSSPSKSRLTGTWTILPMADDSRANLLLKSTGGDELVYVLGAAGSGSILVDGTAWRWVRVP